VNRSSIVNGQSSIIRPLTWAEIDLRALIDNYRALCSLLEPPLVSAAKNTPIRNPQSAIRNRLIPVIKADAYGHGAVPVARALLGAGAQVLAVAMVEEGIALRDAGIAAEILVLEGAWPGQEGETLRWRLTPSIHSTEGVARLERAAREAEAQVRVHLNLDTGMSRLGVPWEGVDPVLEALARTDRVILDGTFSHLACAEEEDQSFTREQIRRFHHVVARVRARGLNPGELHLANSAGLLFHPELRSQSARPGIALYGYAPSPARCSIALQPVMSLKSTVYHVHTLAQGTSVGYNRLFVAPRATRAATLPIGYADGYRRSLAGQANAIVRDRMVPVLGSVNMDLIVIDITDVPEVMEGDEVILLGSSAGGCVDAAAWAGMLGTNPYEVLCGIGPRVPRIYVDEAY
jgi:alanine racemase